MMFVCFLFFSFTRQLRYLNESFYDNIIATPDMREPAFAAVLYAVFKISEIASASVAQRIERTVTEQAVEVLRINRFVTRKISAAPVAEKFKMFHLTFFHIILPFCAVSLCGINPCYVKIIPLIRLFAYNLRPITAAMTVRINGSDKIYPRHQNHKARESKIILLPGFYPSVSARLKAGFLSDQHMPKAYRNPRKHHLSP